MRATIELPDPIFRRMKAVAAMQGSTIKEFVLRAVERELAPVLANKKGHRIAEREPGSTTAKKRRGGKLPLIQGAGRVIRPLSGEEMDELLFG
jgi:hypothetical protein